MEPNKEQVVITFPNKQVAARVVDEIITKKPTKWGRNSYASYYKQAYAEWIKKDIDVMIESRESMAYRYDSFRTVKPNALYSRVNQAIHYLCDMMDEDGRYKKWRNEVKIERKIGVGIAFSYEEVIEGETRAERFIPEDKTPKWKKKMDEWLESDSVEPFHQGGLLLDAGEIAQIETELSGLNLMYSVNSREVKILKGGV